MSPDEQAKERGRNPERNQTHFTWSAAHNRSEWLSSDYSSERYSVGTKHTRIKHHSHADWPEDVDSFSTPVALPAAALIAGLQ